MPNVKETSPLRCNMSTLDSSMWEINTFPVQQGQFLSSQMIVKNVYRPQKLGQGINKSVLTSPYDITFLRSGKRGFYLVSEPLLSQVGVYSELDMKYLGPLGRGNVQYQTPTSILAMSMGGLVLVDKNKLYIYDEHCHLLQVGYLNYKLQDSQKGQYEIT